MQVVTSSTQSQDNRVRTMFFNSNGNEIKPFVAIQPKTSFIHQTRTESMESLDSQESPDLPAFYQSVSVPYVHVYCEAVRIQPLQLDYAPRTDSRGKTEVRILARRINCS